MTATPGIIEYSINDGATWHHGRTVEAWVMTDPATLTSQRAVIREFARQEHGDVERVVTRVLSENDPRAVNNQPPAPAWPPGTPVITSSRETYPSVILTPPATVAGHRVLAWAETRRRDGEYPGGVVLAVSKPDEYGQRTEYVTWYAYTKDGGQTWGADAGHYIADISNAWADFTERALARPATEY